MDNNGSAQALGGAQRGGSRGMAGGGVRGEVAPRVLPAAGVKDKNIYIYMYIYI